MTSILGSPGSRFGVLAGGVSRIYDRDCGVLGRRSGPRFDAVAPHMLAFRGVWESSGSRLGGVWQACGRRLGVVRASSGRRLGVVWEVFPAQPTADPPRRQRPVSLYSRPARRLGEPNPHLPSGAFSSHRMAVAFVLGGGGVPTSMQPSITGDAVWPAHTHGAQNRIKCAAVAFLGALKIADRSDRHHQATVFRERKKVVKMMQKS